MKNRLIYLLFSFSFICFGFNSITVQVSANPIELSLGTVKTDLKQNAINFGLSYLMSIDSLLEINDFLLTGDKSLLLITPNIDIKSGTGDAFSSISVMLTGLPMFFDTTNVNGIIVPNTSKTFHTFPFSIGIETNNKFNIINGIAEIGWVPWYQTTGNNLPQILKMTKFGLFLQGGYKFFIDSTGNSSVGGEIDQSSEKTDNAICRAKGSFGIDTKSILKFSGSSLGLVGNADLWYDFLNSKVYYTIQGKFRLYLTENQERYFDFLYQKGSGVPNFNQGEQYGIGLTVTF